MKPFWLTYMPDDGGTSPVVVAQFDTADEAEADLRRRLEATSRMFPGVSNRKRRKRYSILKMEAA